MSSKLVERNIIKCALVECENGFRIKQYGNGSIGGAELCTTVLQKSGKFFLFLICQLRMLQATKARTQFIYRIIISAMRPKWRMIGGFSVRQEALGNTRYGNMPAVP